ncbi:MAG TPA: amino acid ABC transporter substrate-binding protein [Candidatus Accumulibacter phosphatis]|nr:MAG: Glutamate/aspartate periplasmic-binding protein precursor [Candidatus Accumulibacter sp. SK-11]HAY28912.1 amino acid ABC transporter substrate-binding protein [Accumulibacter sp.]HRL77052.1 amino acid ABC transporter substrate-binding protein [Candidatus Accumulibacter phosphatis]HCN68687.1 amino acid ABC transporter substrate-binding protein [Accumulibacter sp.]HCV13525.1 amino acid ABC transporter substrate-binding protein [Accumulibacter sp.]
MLKRTLLLAGVAASLALAVPVSASESVLAKIKQSGTLKLGYRENSIPFSFIGDDKQPRGYSVDLCRIVADDIGKQLNVPKLDVRWVPVTAQTRFTALKSGEIDLECGNTTQTLSRRADFDFSLMTFVDGAGLLFREGETPTSVEALKGQRVAVVSGTTTEKTLNELIRAGKLDILLIKVADHDAAINALTNKTATAYAADRTVLITTALIRGKGQPFALAEMQFSYEPYALMMRRDDDFRLAVDRTLARLYRSGEIGPIVKRWFEPFGKPGDALQAMFLLNGLPE